MWALIFLALQLISAGYIERRAFADEEWGDSTPPAFTIPEVTSPADYDEGYYPAPPIAMTPVGISEVGIPNVTLPAITLPDLQLSYFNDIGNQMTALAPLPTDSFNHNLLSMSDRVREHGITGSGNQIALPIGHETPPVPLFSSSDTDGYGTRPLVICKNPYPGATEQTFESPYSLLEQKYFLVGSELKGNSIVEYYSKIQKFTPPTTSNTSGRDITSQFQFYSLPDAKSEGPTEIASTAHVSQTPYPDGVRVVEVRGVYQGELCPYESTARYVIFDPKNIIYYDTDKNTGITSIKTDNLTFQIGPFGRLEGGIKQKSK